MESPDDGLTEKRSELAPALDHDDRNSEFQDPPRQQFDNPLRIVQSTEKELEQQKHAGANATSSGQTTQEPSPGVTTAYYPPKTDRKAADTYEQKNYDLQKANTLIQLFLCIFTLGAFGTAGYYTYIAAQQRDLMNDTLKEAHVQNVAQQRAILTVDGDPFVLMHGDIGLRIKNLGRMSAKITSFGVKYSQLVTHGKPFMSRERTITQPQIVTPEEPFVISIKLPPLPDVPAKERYYFGIELTILYDDGFGDIQTIKPCLRYNLDDGAWKQSCMWVNAVDLSTDLPDRTKPAQQK